MNLRVFRFVALVGAALCIGSFPASSQLPMPLRRLPTRDAPAANMVSPKSIAIGGQDRIYVGDEAPARVLSFDSSGVLLRIIGREGSGPGEFRSPRVGAGAFLVVNDGQLKRLSAFDADGHQLWSKPGACCRSRAIRVDQADRIYVVSSPLIIGGGLPLDDMLVFSPQGSIVDTLRVPGFGGAGEGRREWTLMNKQAALATIIPFMPTKYFAITRAGAVLWGYSASYTLMEGPDASSATTTIQRPWTAISLSPTERKRARDANIEYYVKMVDKTALEAAFRLEDVPERSPAFFGLDVDACGRWWILRTSAYMDSPPIFDVFSGRGAPLATVQIAEHLMDDTKWVVGRTRLAAIVQDGTGAPTLGVYQFPRIPGC